MIRAYLYMGSSLFIQGQVRESLSYSQRALELVERVFGPRHPWMAQPLSEVGAAYADLGDLEGAKQAFGQALSITEEVYGPNDIRVADELIAISSNLATQGLYLESRAYLERARSIYEATLGEHPDTGMIWARLASMEYSLEDFEASLRCYDTAISNVLPSYGEEHVLVARLRSARAVVLAKLGQHDEAKAVAEASVAVVHAAVGPEDWGTLMTVRDLAAILADAGDYEGALARYREVLAGVAATMGPHDHETASAHYDIAKVEFELQHYDRVLEEVALVREGLGDESSSPDFWAMIDFLEARARWNSGMDRASARRLAEQAEAFFEGRPKNSAIELTKVRQWLLEHRLGGTN